MSTQDDWQWQQSDSDAYQVGESDTDIDREWLASIEQSDMDYQEFIETEIQRG